MSKQCRVVRLNCFYFSFNLILKYWIAQVNTAHVMKLMLLHYLTGIGSLWLSGAVDTRATDCQPRNLTATVDDVMRLYIDGVEMIKITTRNYLDYPVELPCNASVIGIEGRDEQVVGSILASTDDGYILTNSSWKCTKSTITDWQTTDFDDWNWPQAVEITNSNNVPQLRKEARLIWTAGYHNEDKLVYCRKTFGPSAISSGATDLLWKAKPSYGPIAGGTKVNITIVGWSKTNLNVFAVYFGDNLKASILRRERSEDNLVVLTPPANESAIGKPLTISVKFTPGLFTIKTKETFTYGENPNITDITPKRFLVNGGMSMTVIGNYLNSVANPFVHATVIVYRDAEFNSTTTSNDSTTTYEPCNSSTGNGSQMLCVMPRISLPKDFLDALQNTSYVDQSNVGPNGKDKVDITIGFDLDGYRKYQNITEAIPGLQLEFYAPPEINSSKELLCFNLNNDETIRIKGHHLTLGCQTKDYKVHLGSGVCSITTLTDNVLTCRPPTSEPEKTSNDVNNCERNLAVIVTIGYFTYHHACLTYCHSFNKIALGAGLGGGLLVLFIALIIIVAVCVARRRRNIAKENASAASSAGINGVESLYDRKIDSVALAVAPTEDDYNRSI